MKVFVFFPHESTATGFLDCFSIGSLGSILLIFYLSSKHGMGRGWGGGVHIQGCTLMITVVFPLKRVFILFCWHTVLLRVLHFTAQTAIPIAFTELWQIKLCLHQTCFCIQLIWSTCTNAALINWPYCVSSGWLWNQCRLWGKDPFVKTCVPRWSGRTIPGSWVWT